MSRVILLSIFVVGLVSVGIFLAAGRSISELVAYLQAGATTTVNSLEEKIPDAVTDAKTVAELATARRQLVDRRVQMNLSQNQVKKLEQEFATLEKSVSARTQVLASAYPALERALQDDASQVVFVSQTFALPDFQREIDDLLALQEQDETTLEIKLASLERLQTSIAEGEATLAELQRQITQVEEQYSVMKTRRQQAHLESEALDFVDQASSEQGSVTAQLAQSVQKMVDKVQQIEARNDARREVSSVERRSQTNRIAKPHQRLEALKRYASQASDQEKREAVKPDLPQDRVSDNVPPAVESPAVAQTEPKMREFVIRIPEEQAEQDDKQLD